MPRPQKKQKLEDGQQNGGGMTTDDDDNSSSFDRLGTDALANIFGFLLPEDIMLARLNKKMREAAKKTIVPLTDFVVDSVRKYNALVAMSTALPNLQQISVHGLDGGHKYSDGEDPNEGRAAKTANFITHDINFISRFRRLRSLELYFTPLNGRYAALFDFPLLHKLSIKYTHCLKWNLEMLEGLPLLKELFCASNESLTGNIDSLRVLKDTLEKVTFRDCPHIEGNFMDLADFPRLKELNLRETYVTGDIRDVGERDFPTLELLALPSSVYGGPGHEFQRISDAPGIIRTLYSIKRQRPNLLFKYWYGKLSKDSPDWYGLDDEFDEYYVGDGAAFPSPPLHVCLVAAGSRVGYRWETIDGDHPCEVNWLDPEPHRESSDYEKYIRELRVIEERVYLYQGFHEPPSEEEFNRLASEINGD
mmetsp:Transcript_25753/g.43680  ORF Transcript_25753/g.43680 Transcript_25753/m.43680 type:complete len:420 (+) Transcript_25753:95-1354(+)